MNEVKKLKIIAVCLVLMAMLIIVYTLPQIVRAAQLGLNRPDVAPPTLSLLGVLGWWITAQLLATIGGIFWLRAHHGSQTVVKATTTHVQSSYWLHASPLLGYLVPYGFLLGPMLIKSFLLRLEGPLTLNPF